MVVWLLSVSFSTAVSATGSRRWIRLWFLRLLFGLVNSFGQLRAVLACLLFCIVSIIWLRINCCVRVVFDMQTVATSWILVQKCTLIDPVSDSIQFIIVTFAEAWAPTHNIAILWPSSFIKTSSSLINDFNWICNSCATWGLISVFIRGLYTESRSSSIWDWSSAQRLLCLIIWEI